MFCPFENLRVFLLVAYRPSLSFAFTYRYHRLAIHFPHEHTEMQAACPIRLSSLLFAEAPVTTSCTRRAPEPLHRLQACRHKDFQRGF